MPIASATSWAIRSSRKGRAGDLAMTATARSPRTRCATLANKALSTPPEKATITSPISARIPFSVASFASSPGSREPLSLRSVTFITRHLPGDEARGARGAEAVVDVDDADAGGAAVEHGEQRGEPGEARPVSHTGGDGDHRRRDEPGDDARQRAAHAGDDDCDQSFFQRGEVAKDPVQACDARIFHGDDRMAKGLERAHRLLGDGLVGS